MWPMGYFFGKSDEDDKYEHTMAEHRNASVRVTALSDRK